MTKKRWDFNKNGDKDQNKQTKQFQQGFLDKEISPTKTQLSVFFWEFSFEFDIQFAETKGVWSCVFVKAEGAQNAQCDGAQFESQAV